jgi:tetraacyldisaccharide 4'-kinase
MMTQGGVGATAFSSPLEWLLYACSQAYELAARLRVKLYETGFLKQQNLQCKVVSIGNITVGGTGKTPVTLHVADLLRRMGYKVAVISRGYGGSAGKKAGIVSDGQEIKMTPEEAGDEPYMISLKLKGIPVIVGRDRVKAGRFAIGEFGSDIIVLDDGFQHLGLRRDLNIVLLDSANPFGNGYLLPRGVLREPLSHLGRADAFVLTRSDLNGTATSGVSFVQEIAAGRPVFNCAHIPDQIIGNGQSATYPQK